MPNILDQILHELECTNDMLRSVVQVTERDIIRTKYIDHVIATMQVLRKGNRAYIINDELEPVLSLASPEAMSTIQVKYKALTGQQADNATVLTILDGLNLKSYDYSEMG